MSYTECKSTEALIVANQDLIFTGALLKTGDTCSRPRSIVKSGFIVNNPNHLAKRLRSIISVFRVAMLSAVANRLL